LLYNLFTKKQIQPRRWLRRGWKGNAVTARCGKIQHNKLLPPAQMNRLPRAVLIMLIEKRDEAKNV